MARTSDRREFLQLSHVYDKSKHAINGWFASEKLDGQRAYWDGGLTRGLYCHEIPFANTAKDGVRLSPPKSTGLWSRQGKPIQAPTWFLDELPAFPLDGELTAGRGNFQQTMSTCRKLDPIDSEWENIGYRVFDLPDYTRVFQDGRISTPNWNGQFAGILEWAKMKTRMKGEPKLRRFESVVFLLNKEFSGPGIVQAVEQVQLPYPTNRCNYEMESYFDRMVNAGAEGIMLRHPNSIWEPQRTNHCLKVKPFEDAEVTIVGYISGKETDKGSKLRGLIGAMITDFKGLRLELSGFTDEERKLHGQEAFDWCYNNPGMNVPLEFTSVQFPRGSKVTVRYRELTKDGLPKECRYWRTRPEE